MSPTPTPAKKGLFHPRGLLRRGFTIFPLLTFPVLVYALMAVFAGDPVAEGLAPVTGALAGEVFSIPMISGVTWQVTAGDMLLFFALGMLSVEIIKATSTRSGAIINHAASMGLLIVCILLFLTMENFATSIFMVITLMTLLDVLAGVIVTIVSARRDFGVGDGFGG